MLATASEAWCEPAKGASAPEGREAPPHNHWEGKPHQPTPGHGKETSANNHLEGKPDNPQQITTWKTWDQHRRSRQCSLRRAKPGASRPKARQRLRVGRRRRITTWKENLIKPTPGHGRKTSANNHLEGKPGISTGGLGNARYSERSLVRACLLYTSPSPRDKRQSRMPSSA